MKKPNSNLFIRFSVTFCKFLVGSVFVFSGFVKAVDPTGTQIKFEEYLRFFNMDCWFSANLLLIAACLLAGLEFLLGIYMLLGVYRKSTTLFMLLIMACFTPLTLYLAISSPVSDCGCFGDALVLTNWQTFFKNIFLLIAIVYLFIYKEGILQFVNPVNQWLVTVTATLLIILFMLHNINHLPIFDFRAYKKGVNLREMVVERGDIRFVDLSVWDDTDEDFTENILNYNGYTFLLIFSFLEDASQENLDFVDDLYYYTTQHGYRFFAVTSSGRGMIEEWRSKTGAEYDFLFADEVLLKTMIRSNPGLILLNNGIIVDKWSHKNIPSESELSGFIENIYIDKIGLDSLKYRILRVFLIFLTPFLLIIIFDRMFMKRRESCKIRDGEK